MKEGITKGQVPVGDKVGYAEQPQAANLTSNENRDGQRTWGAFSQAADKTRIRLRVNVPDSQLTNFREVKVKYGISAKWLKALGSYHERKHWFFAFGGVRPDQIEAVEVYEQGAYRPLSSAEVKTLLEMIERERSERFELAVVRTGVLKGATSYQLKPTCSDSWLLDASPEGEHELEAVLKQIRTRTN
jgi:hypothetical protein